MSVNAWVHAPNRPRHPAWGEIAVGCVVFVPEELRDLEGPDAALHALAERRWLSVMHTPVAVLPWVPVAVRLRAEAGPQLEVPQAVRTLRHEAEAVGLLLGGDRSRWTLPWGAPLHEVAEALFDATVAYPPDQDRIAVAFRDGSRLVLDGNRWFADGPRPYAPA